MGKISDKQIAEYAVSQLESGVKTEEIAGKIAALLLEERRTRDASSLLRMIERELNIRGSTQMTITSAHGVTTEIKNQLASILKVESPVIAEVIESDVIGGVRARAGEREIDLTVRTRLNKFKQQIKSQGT